jgi:dolichol kinase
MTGARGEAARKLIHVAVSLVAAGVLAVVPYPAGVIVLAAATLVALAVEVGRRLMPSLERRFRTAFGAMLREGEEGRLTGATTLAVGYTAAALLAPGWPAVAGILVMGLADPAAALVGRRAGRHRYPGGKSLEGSLAFLGAAFMVLLAIPGVSAGAAALLAGSLAVVEAPTFRIDDNLYLPALAAGLVWLLIR